ncbi:MAG: PIG-L family deacetylase, partial [Flammeovirgaceae bacterium]|nr:PIG-L family deacetylase [Flammeovirgaceae bacterium]MDW8287351.1 PIG-L family deacetylase [Flammeovirgaceae bacterium]
AAHPDDENTRLISYFAKGKGFETTYLSLTRGDGGQNLIGKELEEQLGVLRTQELLAARRIDGGQQLFTRAKDFGFSKDPTETLQIWDKQAILADVVWAIRRVRPDIIITRFSPTLDGTHGHHTASAQLALEAFHLAGDANAFPEQLTYVQIWKPKRIFWNTSPFFFQNRTDEQKLDLNKVISIDVGEFNPLLGKSYVEIASLSRSQHKSQGFGSALQRGTTLEYLWQLAGEPAQKDPMEGIDTSWKRIGEKGSEIENLLKKIESEFQVTRPSASLSDLLLLRQQLIELPQEEFWVKKKRQHLENLILQCAGIWLEATADTYRATPGDSLELTIRLICQTPTKVFLKAIDYLGKLDIMEDTLLPYNQLFVWRKKVKVSENTPISQPYWLVEKGTEGMYRVDELVLRGEPENSSLLPVNLVLQLATHPHFFYVSTPIFYRWVDASDGERYRLLQIAPPVTMNLSKNVYLFTDNQPRKIEILLKAHTSHQRATISLQLPDGWKSNPTIMDVFLKEKYEEQKLIFTITPPTTENNEGFLKVIAHVVENKWTHGIATIDYRHIPPQVLFPKAEAKLVKTDLKKLGKKIGYIAGAGDAIPASLQEMGYEVSMIETSDFENLQQYDAIVLGVRAYNTNPLLRTVQKKLFEYVAAGGTMLVQYNTFNAISELVVDKIAPFHLQLSRDRVTDEKAPMKILVPNHPIFNIPNKITEQDFEGWVQERGLYFPNDWGPEFIPLLACADAGEKATQGALLVAEYGKGKFIYTGLSFFRQLPSGVVGAYRLFANMLSWGKQ